MEIKAVHPPTVGWLEGKLGEKEMKYVWKCIENKKEDCKENLAGNIDSSFHLKDEDDWFYTNTITPFIIKYAEHFSNALGNFIPTNQRHPYHMERWWVNYQKQNEFNPLHNHKGIYSFVIWMKIPFSWEKQNKKDIARRSSEPSISSFQFSYLNILGDTKVVDYQMYPELEGTMLFFPSRLFHTVYPFYDCDEERISVSGNISLDTTKTIAVR